MNIDFSIVLDGEIDIKAVVNLGYRVHHPEFWGNTDPQFESELEWWIDNIESLALVGPKGELIPLSVDLNAVWIVKAVRLAICDDDATRACSTDYESWRYAA